MVYKVDNRLGTDLFVKETDRNNLLSYDSNRPRHILDLLPWSQFLQVRRIVSDESRVESRLKTMCQKFVQRGYPEKEVYKYKTKAI